jgi:hypothetical protein
LRSLRREVDKLKAGKQALSSGGNNLNIHQAKVVQANGTTPETYTIRILTGRTRAETNYLVTKAMPVNPDATFSEDDYVAVVLRNGAPAMILSSAGSGGVLTTVPRHGHGGYYDGGWLAGGDLAGGL